MATQTPAPAQKIQVTISQLKAGLKAGKTRREIGKALGLSVGQTMEMFKHPKLKGLKVYKSMNPNLELVDDEDDDDEEVSTTSASDNGGKASKAAPKAKASAEQATAQTANTAGGEGTW